MSESFANDNKTMGKYVAVLTAVCLMLCLSFNYTFPLHRDSTKAATLDNQSLSYEHAKQEHSDSLMDRTKKMAANLEHALRKFIESTPNKAKAEKCSHANHRVIDNDLSNYEQLVIMKKYPFLDLQELDLNVGQLSNENSGHQNTAQVLAAQDPSSCEFSDEGPSVEITNRGLSGFALPAKLLKPDSKEYSADVEVDNNNAQTSVKEFKMPSSSSTENPSDDLRLIESLEEDIKIFEQHNMG